MKIIACSILCREGSLDQSHLTAHSISLFMPLNATIQAILGVILLNNGLQQGCHQIILVSHRNMMYNFNFLFAAEVSFFDKYPPTAALPDVAIHEWSLSSPRPKQQPSFVEILLRRSLFPKAYGAFVAQALRGGVSSSILHTIAHFHPSLIKQSFFDDAQYSSSPTTKPFTEVLN